ncbi:hypothetical protein [uncultured Dysosmobacter sp.]|uniref:hypothetical protein n=1 Tax=uncultured Dysosmobacter sp. TaxID=2591384 RepID=UPI002611665B|nr:hypothetical protein [uncultured Dysosmobacter sp.]
MALKKITEEQLNEMSVSAAPDILSGTPAQNKAVFDRLPKGVAAAHNELVDALMELGVEQAVLAPEGAGFKYLRLNSNLVLEFSDDGETWQTTGSQIVDGEGNTLGYGAYVSAEDRERWNAKQPAIPGKAGQIPVFGEEVGWTGMDQVREATAALYGKGPGATVDEVLAAAPDTIDPIGTVKVTVRKDLGENWALCNGDQYFESDVSKAFWDAANDPDVILHEGFGTASLPVSFQKTSYNAISGLEDVMAGERNDWKYFYITSKNEDAATSGKVGYIYDFYFIKNLDPASLKTLRVSDLQYTSEDTAKVILFHGAYYILFVNKKKVYTISELDGEEALSVLDNTLETAMDISTIRAVTPFAVYSTKWSTDTYKTTISQWTTIDGTAKTLIVETDRYLKMFYDWEAGHLIGYGDSRYSSSSYPSFVSLINETLLRVTSSSNLGGTTLLKAPLGIVKLGGDRYLIYNKDKYGKTFTVADSVIAFSTDDTTYDLRLPTSLIPSANTLLSMAPEVLENGLLVGYLKSMGLMYVSYDAEANTYALAHTNTQAVLADNAKGLLRLDETTKKFAVSDVFTDAAGKVYLTVTPVNRLPLISLNRSYAYIRIR